MKDTNKQENVEITIELVNKLAKYLFLMMYNEETNIEIKVNTRLKRTLGQFVIFDDDECYIDLSKVVMKQNLYVIADILSHELVHYYLWKNALPYDDNDEEFRNMVRKYGVLETNTCVVKNGKIYYKYHQHEFKCECGFHTYSYELICDNNFRMKIECPTCKKKLTASYVGMIEDDYDPTFHIKLCVDCFLKRLKEENEPKKKKRKVS